MKTRHQHVSDKLDYHTWLSALIVLKEVKKHSKYKNFKFNDDFDILFDFYMFCEGEFRPNENGKIHPDLYRTFLVAIDKIEEQYDELKYAGVI